MIATPNSETNPTAAEMLKWVPVRYNAQMPPPDPSLPRGGAGVEFRDALRSVLMEDGMTDEESEPLIDFLKRHSTRPEFICRFRWESGSLAFWDNRCTIHNPVNDYHGFRRVMHRVTLAEDRPR